ncbi:MAG: putative lipid II flippase FtsW [Candidatus Nanopelagicales bacterium]
MSLLGNRAVSRPAWQGVDPQWRERISNHPMAGYYLLLGSSMLLLGLGLIMVLSSSTVESYDVYGSVFTLASRQAIVAAIGVALMMVLSRLPVAFFRRFAWAFLLFSVVMLLMVFLPGIGVSVNGQRNWIRFIGPFRLQPSEFAKLALIIWSADLFARKNAVLDRWAHLAVPFLPVAGGLITLVLAEGDLGTAIIMSLIVAGLLFVAGAPMRIFAGLTAVGVAGVLALSLGGGYRMRRFTAWLHPEGDLDGAGWQLTQGKYALGSGGWWGVGLGGSREKWGALPEAHTDFIFPVIGEELGLFGALTVVALFAVIAYLTIRIAVRSQDMFVRVASVGIITWLVGQAMINLGAVLQLMPITGVPLPLVSYGGSSLLPSLIALGILLAFARAQADEDLLGTAPESEPVESWRPRSFTRPGGSL